MGHFFAPTSLAETIELLAAEPELTLLAGGTDLMADIRYGSKKVGNIATLRGVAKTLSVVSDVHIGAMATWSRLLAASKHRSLREAARTVGSLQIRNVGTLGGNLATASPAGDALPALCALGASVDLVSVRGARAIPVSEFQIAPKRHAGSVDEIIVGVTLPPGSDQYPQSFAKIGARNAMVISQVSACAVLGENDLRLAFGAVAPTVVAVEFPPDVVARLRSLDPAARNEVADICRAAVAPISDHRATRDYRIHAVGVLAQRLVDRIVA